jgi:hypothetical protein
MGYKEMALDAGYKGAEADALAIELELADRLEEERYWHDRAIEEAEMLDMLQEEMNRKFVGICQQSEIRPLKLIDRGEYIEIIHEMEGKERVLIGATHEGFEAVTANEFAEMINAVNRSKTHG